MEEQISEKLQKVEKIIEKIDEFALEDAKAAQSYSKGERLLDECVEAITKQEFKLEELSLKTGKVISK